MFEERSALRHILKIFLLNIGYEKKNGTTSVNFWTTIWSVFLHEFNIECGFLTCQEIWSTINFRFIIFDVISFLPKASSSSCYYYRSIGEKFLRAVLMCRALRIVEVIWILIFSKLWASCYGKKLLWVRKALVWKWPQINNYLWLSTNALATLTSFFTSEMLYYFSTLLIGLLVKHLVISCKSCCSMNPYKRLFFKPYG